MTHAASSTVPSRPAPGDHEYQLSAGVLGLAFGLALWIAAGSLVLAIADGLGDHPVRRLCVGLALVALLGGALWRRDASYKALLARPWLVLLCAAAVMALVAIDGVTEGTKVGPYLVVTVTPLGLAVVVGAPRLVWLCVALLEACFLVAVLSELAVGDTTASVASLLGASLAYPFAALVIVGLAGLFTRFLGNVDGILDEIRAGAPSLTPGLTRAVMLEAGRPIGLLVAPSLLADLTPSEQRVVEALARGSRPKQVAFAWGVSLPAVRKHIRNAKRKTGARTLTELAAICARHQSMSAVGDEAEHDDR